MEAINLADAKARLSELVSRAEGGEEVQISRRGRPVAKLVPLHPAKRAINLAALRAFRSTLPYDPVNSVLEMRKLDKY